MPADSPSTERLRNLLARITELTTTGELHWERQINSAHRYARWNNNLLILGPNEVRDKNTPRYLFITPFDSPDCIEVNSTDAELGPALVALVRAVEVSTRDEAPTDPFAVTEELLGKLDG